MRKKQINIFSLYLRLFWNFLHRERSLLAIDVSGSISEKLYARFLRHIGVLSYFGDFQVLFFSHKQVGLVEGKTLRNTRGTYHTGEGTDYQVIYNYWQKSGNYYKNLFIFTDDEALDIEKLHFAYWIIKES